MVGRSQCLVGGLLGLQVPDHGGSARGAPACWSGSRTQNFRLRGCESFLAACPNQRLVTRG